MNKTSHRTLTGGLMVALLAGSAYTTVALADTPGTTAQPKPKQTQTQTKPQVPQPGRPLPPETTPPSSGTRTAPEPIVREPVATVVDKSMVEGYLRAWPERPAQVARQLLDKYGLPTEATASMLIWRDNGPFKKTVVHREEIVHNFPTPHWDFLEQTVQLRVPVTKIDDLAAFDGSLVVKRTQGLVSVRCDSEANNILALNLAHDVATGKKSATQARAALTKAAGAMAKGEAVEDARTLRLPASATDATADPDKASLKANKEAASPSDVTTPAMPSTVPSPSVPTVPTTPSTPDNEPITAPKVLPPGQPAPAPVAPKTPKTPGPSSPRK